MFYHAGVLAVILALSTSRAYGAGFSYDPSAPDGPGNWEKLGDNDCGGSENSPLAIEDRDCDEYAAYTFNAGTCTVKDATFTINNHGVKVDYPDDGSCERPTFEMPGKGRGGIYTALQFHIHTGSEHTIDRVTFGAEMHIVHQKLDCDEDQQRCYAVVGTKLNPASLSDSKPFQDFLLGWVEIHNDQEAGCDDGTPIDYRASRIGTSEHENTVLNPYAFNEKSQFFHYAGGLTTPPCSEIVWWNLDVKTAAISPEQYTALVRIILGYRENCEKKTVAYNGSSSRPTQPQFGRTVWKICPPLTETDATKL
eukprot:CAMPEP_0183307592 /NCGR_PEP_ID=MMETSP0160_2-20130417/18182_1 /TAXON_ID=2839 ORGANISM="Odontella Sinensis, Strain Grunow 1884" /NCGR_SAMPLE_ID=MMETSP0160_2 /ASSEMBLY_ACC=CAM_ASM_000250 /LENGTH=308 /DNA_ID=CAMNT_0025471205 /DNA_START=40 /DNA_END=966 /DNA_ORIENTATION=+